MSRFSRQVRPRPARGLPHSICLDEMLALLRRSVTIFAIAIAVAACNGGPDTPDRNENQVCLTFTSIRDSCIAAFESHTGCTVNQREYSWNSGCLGYYERYRTTWQTLCFDEQPSGGGMCREGLDGSLPPDGFIP